MDNFLIISYWLIFSYFLYRSVVAKSFYLNWVLITTAVILNAIYFYGWVSLYVLAIIAVVSTVAELVSLKTNFNVFGVKYKYNLVNKLFKSRVVLGNVYPLEVVAAWVLFKYMSLVLIGIAGIQFGIPQVIRVILSALALVSFDFIIDPIAVSSNAWSWEKQGKYFNIPWQNFLGWFIVGLIVSIILVGFEPKSDFNSLMYIPILCVLALFSISIGYKLIKLNYKQGLFGILPSLLFLLFGIAALVKYIY